MGAKNDCKTFPEELAWVDRIYEIPFFRSFPGLRLTHSWHFYCWAVLRACLLTLQMTESQESLEVYWRTGLVFNLDQLKNGLRKSQYTQVKASASHHTQEGWTHWGDDAKFCRKYPGCRGCQTKEETRMLDCPTIQRSTMQTQGKEEGRDTPNRERSTSQLSCQMFEIPMEMCGIHSNNISG